MEESDDSDKKIGQLSLIQQNLEVYTMQKQQFENQKLEVESALEELEKTNESYRIIGNIMVLEKNEDQKKYLEEKLDVFRVRIKTLEKQEEKLKVKAAELQKEVLSGIKEK